MPFPWTRRVSCAHLGALEKYLRDSGAAVQLEGESWWEKPTGGWVAFECYLAPSLRDRFKLPEFVRYEKYDGKVAGNEAGFFCTRCESGVMGVHPTHAAGLKSFS
jgi:hypothetical protein